MLEPSMLSGDSCLDDLIENGILELEESFFKCFNKKIDDAVIDQKGRAKHGRQPQFYATIDNAEKKDDDNHEIEMHDLQIQIDSAEDIIEKYKYENKQLKTIIQKSAMKIESESKQLFVNAFNELLSKNST